LNVFSDGDEITLVEKKSQFNLDLIGANEINMQLNETNIVNQFQHKIKFWWVIPGETLRRAVVRICTHKVNGVIKGVHLSYAGHGQNNWKDW